MVTLRSSGMGTLLGSDFDPEVRHKLGRVSDDAAGKAGKMLLRVFFCAAGQKVILLLSGYDNGRDDSPRRQDREIARARKMMEAGYGHEVQGLPP